MERNFLNLSESEKDQPIYRVISVNRLLELINDNHNVLVKPSSWDDPFENYIMNATGEMEDGQMFSVGFRDNYFGQCWTKTEESDAMWRIYSGDDHNGVRISTTPRKLLKALYDSAGQYKDINCHIGGVRYYSTPELEQLLRENASAWITDSTGAGQAQTLLFKRLPFQHENEVRLIFNGHGKVLGKLFRYLVDALEMIDDIVFDPRMDVQVYNDYKDKLIQLGFNKNIDKSKLYDAPQLRFRFKV